VRHLGIDAVKLPEIDPLQLQPAQTHHHALAQIFRSAEQFPALRPAAGEPALGGDDDVLVGMQRLGDQFLADIGTVALRRVDEIDAELRQPLQDPDRLAAIGRRAPDPLARERMAPKPSRCTVRSPPMANGPEECAVGWGMGCSWDALGSDGYSESMAYPPASGPVNNGCSGAGLCAFTDPAVSKGASKRVKSLAMKA
jgi:hypothetical protein